MLHYSLSFVGAAITRRVRQGIVRQHNVLLLLISVHGFRDQDKHSHKYLAIGLIMVGFPHYPLGLFGIFIGSVILCLEPIPGFCLWRKE